MEPIDRIGDAGHRSALRPYIRALGIRCERPHGDLVDLEEPIDELTDDDIASLIGSGS